MMPIPKDQLLSLIEQQLEKIRKPLILHGGNVELVDADETLGEVRVRLHGMCAGCPMAGITLKAGIEAALQEVFPWIKHVIAVE